MTPGRWTDERVEIIIGNLLRAGVLLAAAVVLVGGVMYLLRFGGQPVGFHSFRAEPSEYRTLTGVVGGVRSLHGRSLIQFGLLLLIATPVARVAFALVAFALQRDRTYVVVTAIVLGILLSSLLSGR